MSTTLGSTASKFALLFLATILLLFNSGCLTAVILDHTSTPYQCTQQIDTIYAIAVPDEKSKSFINNKGAIFFLGKNNTYFLSEGGDQILKLANILGNTNLYIHQSNSDPLPQIYDKNIQGSIRLGYSPGKSITFSGSDLVKMGLHKTYQNLNDYYIVDINIKGMILPPQKINQKLYSNNIPKQFSYCKMEFRSVLSPFPKQMVPIFTTIDIISFPAQVCLGIPLCIVALGGH
jgi:hypothetical protein